MSLLDWLVLGAYGVIVFSIGAWAARRQKSGEDYFLGGRNLAWWAVGLSLLATSFSAASLVSGAQFGFRNGMAWIQLQMGDVLAMVIVVVVFLPFFSSLRLTTAYEYLGRRFGRATRSVASALFILQTLARVAILVYVPAITLSAMVGWSVETCIVATAVVASAYSATGGMAAVVWTDTLQMLIVVGAIIASLVLMSGDVEGGLGALYTHASEAGRMEFVTWPESRQHAFSNLFTVTGALVPYAVLATSLFGTGQQAVQRYLSCKDLAGARRAALTGPVVGTLVLGLSLLLGALLASWADMTGVVLAADGDAKVLPEFVMLRLPVGLRGLMLAAVFAAAMSSLDSAVHSMSTAVLVDFVRPSRKNALAPSQELKLARVLTVVFGVVAILGALYAETVERTILDQLVTWLGYAAGPLLGMFLLGITSRRTNETGVLSGVLVGVLVVIVLVLADVPSLGGFHPLWLAPASCAITWLIGRVVSSSFPAPAPEDIDGLTWATRPKSRP